MDAGSNIQLYVALRVVLLPAGAAVLALVAARLFGRREDALARLVAIGAAAGAVVAYLGIAGVPPIPPIDTIGWIPFATLAALLVLLPLDARPHAQRIALFVVVAATAFLIGKPVWSAASTATAAMWVAVVAIVVTAVADGLVLSSGRIDPRAVLFAVTAVAIGSSVTSVASHSALLSLILGGVAATTGALAVGGFVLGVRPHGRALFGVLAVAIAGPVLYGRLYSGIPATSVALLVAAALAPLAVVALPKFRGRTIVAPILALALALGAAAIAQQEGAAKEGGGEDLYYK